MPESLNIKEGEESFYSNEVKDIISQRPSWLVRNGIALFLSVLCGIITVTYFVQYPDIVIAKARLVSVNPPVELKTKTAGKLVSLLINEKDSVQSGQIIAIIESIADANKILRLHNTILKMQDMVSSGQIMQAVRVFEVERKTAAPGAGLGEVQENYHNFINAYQVFTQYLERGFYNNKKLMLNGDLNFLQRLKQNYQQQKLMLGEDIDLASKNFFANESLNKDKVIADMEFRNEKSKLIGKRLSLPQLTASIIGNESALHEKRKEIMALENEIMQQKMIFKEALNSFLAALDQWQDRYIVKAPFAGRIAFAEFINVNQYYPVNQTICLVNPGISSFYAQVFIAQNNFGKIQSGQKVLLKLPAYPYQEFGLLKGTLDYVSLVPADSGFVGKVNLPRGMATSQHKLLQYREGLTANAEIIAADRRLIQRLFSSLYSVLERK